MERSGMYTALYTAVGLDRFPLTHLLLTHAHPHCGNARYFQQKGAKVIAGEEDARQSLSLGDYDPAHFPCVLHDFEEDCLFEFCKADVAVATDCGLALGELTVEVILTPGHTQGSVVYMIRQDGKKYLFSGDTFGVTGGRGNTPILGTTASVDYCAEDFVCSMQKLLNRYPDAIFSGHGFPRFGDCNRLVAACCMRATAERR